MKKLFLVFTAMMIFLSAYPAAAQQHRLGASWLPVFGKVGKEIVNNLTAESIHYHYTYISSLDITFGLRQIKLKGYLGEAATPEEQEAAQYTRKIDALTIGYRFVSTLQQGLELNYILQYIIGNGDSEGNVETNDGTILKMSGKSALTGIDLMVSLDVGFIFFGLHGGRYMVRTEIDEVKVNNVASTQSVDDDEMREVSYVTGVMAGFFW